MEKGHKELRKSFQYPINTRKMRTFIYIILTFVQISLGFTLDPYDFSKSYFCSTCFTNNQDQNYHCCFYFFKCCGEARRGSKSTTSGPHYPAIPTQIAYFVRDKSGHICSKNCQSDTLSTVLCCPSNSDSQSGGLSFGGPTVNYLRAEQEFDGYVEADTMVKSPNEEDDELSEAFTKHWSTPEKLATTDKQTHLALDANSRPSNLDPRHSDFSKKLFIPPSLASGHESLDSAAQNSKKLGWITKDLLKLANGENES